jgi:hypothetical protein
LWSSVFWNVMSCSPFLPTCFILVYYVAQSSITKVEATRSSETLVGFQRTTPRDSLKDKTLRNHSCEDVNS